MNGITAKQLDAAVQHSLAHGAMAHDDMMTTLVTDTVLHQGWPEADQAAYRAIARQMSAPAAPTARTVCTAAAPPVDRPAYRQGYVAGWQYGLLCGLLCGGLSTGLAAWLVWLGITAWQCPTC